MTVQELIDNLNKIEDKQKDIVYCDNSNVKKIYELEYNIILY